MMYLLVIQVRSRPSYRTSFECSKSSTNTLYRTVLLSPLEPIRNYELYENVIVFDWLARFCKLFSRPTGLNVMLDQFLFDVTPFPVDLKCFTRITHTHTHNNKRRMFKRQSSCFFSRFICECPRYVHMKQHGRFLSFIIIFCVEGKGRGQEINQIGPHIVHTLIGPIRLVSKRNDQFRSH